MATQYAFVNSDGEVEHTISPASDNDYTVGNTYNGLTCVQMAVDDDPIEFITKRVYVNNAWVTRTARPSDEYDWNSSSNTWVYNSDRGMAALRKDRNSRLGASDWTQVSDNSLTDSQVTEAQTYRTALRNITNGITLPLTAPPSVTWPTKPSFID